LTGSRRFANRASRAASLFSWRFAGDFLMIAGGSPCRHLRGGARLPFKPSHFIHPPLLSVYVNDRK
jgi:hypothetical protein